MEAIELILKNQLCINESLEKILTRLDEIEKKLNEIKRENENGS